MEYALSVVVPVYNAEKTIRRCAESVVLGRLRNVQLILVDDCSTDHSWDICSQLAQEFSNITCIRNENNRGVSATRNRALSAVRGEYVLFVDSDDWVSEHYAEALWRCAKTVPADALVLCAYHYLDYVNHTRSAVLADGELHQTTFVPMTDAFALLEKTFLQQLWNKIFRRDVIEAHHIRFDERMSMGEDFQFVLDYMTAIQCKKCVVLNEPLYYYIRWNNSSLMSKFGFLENQQEFDRVEQLALLAGPDSAVRKDAMIAQIRRNYVYHIVRSRNHSKQEKLAAIERVMGDGKSAVYYREQRGLFAKEQLAEQLGKARQLVSRIKGRMQRSHLQKKIANTVSGVNAEGITFLSQNCIGGVLYHDLGMRFLSPTINAFIPEPGFVKLVLNLRHYIEQELEMHWGEEYPIGTLDDVEIHFMHYDTCKMAKDSWDKRKARINWDKIFVIGTDRDGFDEAVYEQWKEISYPKVLFTAHPEYTANAVYYPEYTADGQIGDLIQSRKFYQDRIILKAIGAAIR